jgi:integrase
MAIKRTGTIIAKPAGLFARVWVTSEDGKKERRWINLETKDRATAKRKLAKIIAMIDRGELVADAKAAVEAPELARDAFKEWVERRKTRGVAMAQSEEGYWKHHLEPTLGALALPEIRKVHVRRALEEARDKGLAKETVAHLRRMLGRFFNELEADERIVVNPMRGVDMPAMTSDKRPRTPLHDDEYRALLAAPVDFAVRERTGHPSVREVEFFEMKVVAFVARTLGGARSAECLRWDWSTIDRENFHHCTIARAKTGAIQALEFPEMLQPFIRAWWEAHGRPDHGPVFPVTRGDRKGEARGATSLAGRFRRALTRALEWGGLPLRHELFNDTPTSKRTDFHTRRREYVSALATGGVNEQTAMALASHADSKVHRRYQIAAIVAVPVAALPVLSVTTVTPANDPPNATQEFAVVTCISGAGHRIRTGDIQLGKLTLYQLS